MILTYSSTQDEIFLQAVQVNEELLQKYQFYLCVCFFCGGRGFKAWLPSDSMSTVSCAFTSQDFQVLKLFFFFARKILSGMCHIYGIQLVLN
jgi:hypothetical protein